MNKTSSNALHKHPDLSVPADLRQALAATPEASAKWNELTPIAKQDFVYWIDSAKQQETRDRRIAKTCSILPAGKRRPCCYSVVPMNMYKALTADPAAKAQWSDLTPTERREFVYWIESVESAAERKQQIEKACAMLVAGKRQP